MLFSSPSSLLDICIRFVNCVWMILVLLFLSLLIVSRTTWRVSNSVSEIQIFVPMLLSTNNNLKLNARARNNNNNNNNWKIFFIFVLFSFQNKEFTTYNFRFLQEFVGSLGSYKGVIFWLRFLSVNILGSACLKNVGAASNNHFGSITRTSISATDIHTHHISHIFSCGHLHIMVQQPLRWTGVQRRRGVNESIHIFYTTNHIHRTLIDECFVSLFRVLLCHLREESRHNTFLHCFIISSGGGDGQLVSTE